MQRDEIPTKTRVEGYCGEMLIFGGERPFLGKGRATKSALKAVCILLERCHTTCGPCESVAFFLDDKIQVLEKVRKHHSWDGDFFWSGRLSFLLTFCTGTVNLQERKWIAHGDRTRGLDR